MLRLNIADGRVVRLMTRSHIVRALSRLDLQAQDLAASDDEIVWAGADEEVACAGDEGAGRAFRGSMQRAFLLWRGLVYAPPG